MTKEICSKCGPERICKNTNGGRRLIQNDDTVLQLHVPIEGCPIYKNYARRKSVISRESTAEGSEKYIKTLTELRDALRKEVV